MDCLRSFNIFANGQANWVPPDVKTWFVGAQEFWAFERTGVSTFIPQGFKNIDIYGVEVTGSLSTQTFTALGGVIPSDWNTRITINGQMPLLGGQIGVTNDFSISTGSPGTNNFELGRFIPGVKFSDPIKSVTSIVINNIRANGVGGQTANNVALAYYFNFVFYYKFEGE